jgi:hypothetical protein
VNATSTVTSRPLMRTAIVVMSSPPLRSSAGLTA